MEFENISPEAFMKKWESGELDEEQILDVREQPEWDYYHLDETRHVPMNTIPVRLKEIPRDREVYIVCAHGSRSQMVCSYLVRQGIDKVVNVEGGMAALAELRGFQYD